MKGYHGVYATILPTPIEPETIWHDYGIRMLSLAPVPKSSGPRPLVGTFSAPASFDLTSTYLMDALNDYYGSEPSSPRVTHCVNVGHWFEEV